MVEVYSALIFHLLTRVIIALAAQKTDQPVEAFSLSRSFDLVEAVTRMGLKDRSAHLL